MHGFRHILFLATLISLHCTPKQIGSRSLWLAQRAQQRCSGTAISWFARAQILQAQQKQHRRRPPGMCNCRLGTRWPIANIVLRQKVSHAGCWARADGGLYGTAASCGGHMTHVGSYLRSAWRRTVQSSGRGCMGTSSGKSDSFQPMAKSHLRLSKIINLPLGCAARAGGLATALAGVDWCHRLVVVVTIVVVVAGCLRPCSSPLPQATCPGICWRTCCTLMIRCPAWQSRCDGCGRAGPHRAPNSHPHPPNPSQRRTGCVESRPPAR